MVDALLTAVALEQTANATYKLIDGRKGDTLCAFNTLGASTAAPLLRGAYCILQNDDLTFLLTEQLTNNRTPERLVDTAVCAC